MMKYVHVLLFSAVVILAAVIPSCSGGEGTTRSTGTGEQELSPAEQKAKDMALQHFIDGSVLEMKADFAAAILEYQDALRYEKNDAIYFGLAKCYSALNKHTLAIEAGREAVRLAPENMEYRRTLADVFIAAFEIDSAAAQYEEIVRQDPGSMDSWYNLARLYQGRRPLKALDVYNSLIERFGPNWDVLLQIAELQNALGQYDQSAEALKKMLEIDPGNQELQENIAQTYARAGRFDTALVMLNALRALNPANLDYVGDIAGIFLEQKEYGKAAEAFEPILSQDSISLDAKLRIGELYFSQFEKDSTLAGVTRSVFERIQRLHPEDWRSYWFLGAVGALTGNDSLAEINFRAVTEKASWNADAWVYLSSVFMEKNNFTEVVKVLEAALKVLPEDFRVNFFLGVAYSRLQRRGDAIRVLEHAHDLNPKDVNAVIQLAIVYDEMKDYNETDRLYEEALSLDPENHVALNNYSYSLAERSLNLNRAFEMAKKAVEAEPDNSSYLDTMGWVYYRLGEYTEAEKYVKKAIEKEDTSAVLHEHLGDIYYKMNDHERALEQWNIALKMDSGNTLLREKIARGSP